MMNYTPQFEEAAKLVAERHEMQFVRYVAHGAFKETFEVIAVDGVPRALKIVDRSKINLARTEREIAALRLCDSPNIAKIFKWESISEGPLLGIDIVIEEFLSGGTLEAKTNNTPVSRAGLAILGLGLSRALIELHERRLVHREAAQFLFCKSGDQVWDGSVEFMLR